MATEDYLIISDGTTTATFADGAAGASNYRIDAGGWAPAVGALALSQLGGRGPYADVVEEMRLSITGSSAAACLANVAALNRLIEQAERWARGENATIVLVKYSPKGATVSTNSAPLQAAVLGRSLADQAGNQPAVHLPPDFNGPLLRNGHYVAHGTLRFMRRGAWLLSATVDGTSSAVANPGPYPITGMTTHPNISPCKVKLANFNVQTTFDYADSLPIMLLAQQGSDLQLVEAEDGVTTAYTSVVDSAHNARGGHVLRYTPTGTTEALCLALDFSSMTSSARRIAFYAAIRNNGSTTYSIRIAALTQVDSSGPVNAIQAYTRPVIINTSTSNPRYVPLGIVSLSAALQQVQLAITASAASSSLDIDYIIALAVDNPYARAVQFNKIENASGYSTNIRLFDATIDPQPLTALTPFVGRVFQGSGDINVNGYYGDAYPVASGTTFQAAMMCKNSAHLDFWNYEVSGTTTSLTLTASRYNAYLVPE